MKFDVLIIGGGSTALKYAKEAVSAGKSCAVVAAGLGLEKLDWSGFVMKGGVLLKGDKVVSSEIDGARVKSVRTANLGDDTIVAHEYVLSTGKFFSGGLVADMEKVYEPLFGLDVKYDKDTDKWTDPDFFAPQPFMSFGVTVDAEGHPSVGGVTIENLYAAGDILAGDR